MRTLASNCRRLTALLATTATLLTIVPSSATAAPARYSAAGLRTTADGEIVTASVRIASSVPVTATYVGICARDRAAAVVDFPFKSSVRLTASGATVTTTKVFSPGSYTYQACAKVNGVWHAIGARRSLTVADPGAHRTLPKPVAHAGAADPGGQPMPVGNLPGWKQVLATDFTTNVAQGRFPGPYASHWTGYDGFTASDGKGKYSRKIISVHNGAMDLYLHTENGVPLVAAPIPLVTGKWGGQTYGKYSVRFRSDWLPHFGAAFLLWPDSNHWPDGEIDFPEGGLSGTIQAFNHRVGRPQAQTVAFNTGVTYINWHTATITWSPAGVVYNLDGKNVAVDRRNIPRKPLHLVLQTGVNGAKPAKSVAGHVLIDWVTIYVRS